MFDVFSYQVKDTVQIINTIYPKFDLQSLQDSLDKIDIFPILLMNIIAKSDDFLNRKIRDICSEHYQKNNEI